MTYQVQIIFQTVITIVDELHNFREQFLIFEGSLEYCQYQTILMF
jgi:hypothetical protein